ncbi:MAG TPA: carbohydrate-binding family 9-like protein [Thermoanaerobaculia bacterium]|nr:carbohydrate-binding family 9-like protein [Thermoanaerobaculia bacterium]
METLNVPRLSPTGRLVELEPIALSDAVTGAAPRLATSVRIGWRSGALLVRFDGRDAGTVATYTRRDEPLWKEDVFEVFLSPVVSPESSSPPVVYYEFEVNPKGALFDARVASPDGRRATMSVNVSWRCPGLGARVRVRPDRWSALLEIPLEPMDSAGGTACWHANFYRVDRGKADEYSAWQPTFANPADFHVPERFGVLELKSFQPFF